MFKIRIHKGIHWPRSQRRDRGIYIKDAFSALFFEKAEADSIANVYFHEDYELTILVEFVG